MQKKFVALMLLLLAASAFAVSAGDARQAFEQARVDLESSKASWQAAQPVNIFDTAEREAGFVLLKDVWIKSGTVVQKKLKLAKAEVGEKPAIASELKDEISQGVDGLVANIESWKTDVSESGTFVEFLGTLRGIKDLWQEFVWKARRYYGLVVLGNSDVLVVKGLDMQHLLSLKISELKSAGKDVSTLEGIYAELESNMNVVVEKSSLARQKVESIISFETSGVRFAEARLAFAEGVEYARKARENLRDARQELVKLGVLD